MDCEGGSRLLLYNLYNQGRQVRLGMTTCHPQSLKIGKKKKKNGEESSIRERRSPVGEWRSSNLLLFAYILVLYNKVSMRISTTVFQEDQQHDPLKTWAVFLHELSFHPIAKILHVAIKKKKGDENT